MSRVRLQITAHSLMFLLGVSVIFIALGYSAGFIGDLLAFHDRKITTIAGIFLIFMGIVMLRILPIPFLNREFRTHMARKPGGYLGSFFVGLAFGAGWTPCIGPILGGILTLAGTGGSPMQGGLLLAVYSIGFGIPFLLAAQALTAWRSLNKYTGIVEKIGAAMLIVVGLVLLFDLIGLLAPYLSNITFEEELLGSNYISGDEIGFGTYMLAFLGGAVSFLSPCVLPILPGFLAYLTGMNSQELLNPDSITAPA